MSHADDRPYDRTDDSNERVERDPHFEALLQSYRVPPPSPGFVDATLCRLAWMQHDPALQAQAASPDFADRVVAAVLADRGLEAASAAGGQRAALVTTTDPSAPKAPRAPAPIEFRSRAVPYWIAAALLVATTIALMWPKGPAATLPRVDAIAAPLFERARSSTDPVSYVGGLVPVSDFTTLGGGADAYEVPRFAPPSLDDFFVADLEARAAEAAAAAGASGRDTKR